MTTTPEPSSTGPTGTQSSTSFDTTTSSNNNCLNQKIIGGQEIGVGNSPFDAEWIVALSMGCGASWINQETILTAAHCFGSQPGPNNQYSAYKKDIDGRKVFIASFTGDQVTIHQQYNDNTASI